MSDISSAYSSTSRITGLFSNLDTDAIVKDLMKVEQGKVDKKKQEKTKDEWYGDALSDVQTLIKQFKSNYLTASTTGSMLSSLTYKSFTTKITSGSDSVVSITATTGASAGSYTVDSITRLAKNASVSSSQAVSAAGTNISESNIVKLSNLNFANALQFDSNGEISFKINGEQFTFNRNDTLQNMVNTINSDDKAGVTMKYSRLTDMFTVTADDGGAKSYVTIENISGNAFGTHSAFGIAAGSTRIDGYGSKGQDADLSINGVSITKSSNDFTIDGVTYSLKNTTDQAVGFSVERDISATVKYVKKFIDDYNTLAGKLNKLLDEKDYSHDYPPLTTDQEKDMSENQINTWNAKAKSGLLRGNSDIKSFLHNMKNAFVSVLGGTGKAASSIGLNTANYYSADSGNIIVDGDKLTAAMEKDPDVVISMFTNSSSDKKGLVYKISDSVASYLDNVADSIKANNKAMSGPGGLDDKIKDMEDGLDETAQKYYNKFSVMETALSKLNSQMSMLSSLFNSKS